eukprot:GFKZ01012862.1.p1 GENE.GFKZ01012862.1~~GFKZ01012862.1.p1  ORF type:complete len:394 (-),score=25.37 GFKZ01012862.1:1098-2279(-)
MIPTPLLTVIGLGGALAILAVVLSTRHIALHLRHYTQPQYQLHIVRILAMVPIYSLTSWFALVAENERTVLVLELIRDSYEAYVIYNFVVLLINYGGGDLHLCRYLESQPRMSHPWPFHLYLPPFKLGPAFLNAIRASVLQFVFVKPTGSFLRLYVFLHPPPLRSLVYILITLLNNISVSLALYGLVLFYHAAHELLLPFDPFAKFLSVKAVVFFSFWQGVVLSIAVRLRILRDVEGFSANEQATGLQDFLICLEMAAAAITHYYVFSYTEHESGHTYTPIGTIPSGRASHHPLLHVVDFRDVLSDAKDRFAGGVGFGSELRDKEPIVPGIDNILGDVTPVPPAYTQPTTRAPQGVSADLISPPWRLPRPPRPEHARHLEKPPGRLSRTSADV